MCGSAPTNRAGTRRAFLLAKLRDEVVVVVAAIRIGEFDRALVGGVADARDQQQRLVRRDAHLMRDLFARIHCPKMLQRAHDRQAALLEVAVQRIADRLRIGNTRSRRARSRWPQRDAGGGPQAAQARDRRRRRQTQLDDFIAIRRLDFAREPPRTRREAASAQHFAEARQPRQRIFIARRDETARTLRAPDQPLFDEQRDRLACGDPRNTERLRQHALRRQRFAGVPAILVDGLAELAGEWQIQRRVVIRVRAEVAPAVFRGRVHVTDARRASGNSMSLARCVIAGFCLAAGMNGRERINSNVETRAQGATMTTDIASVSLPDGERIPKLGQGTWEMGEQPSRRAAEIAALREGIELGMTLIDTAEMYGDGATETLLGEALHGVRDDVFLVSKVYPHNASRRGVQAACEQSLKRLKTERLDLYLLHWRGSVPLAETVEGFEALRRAGKI